MWLFTETGFVSVVQDKEDSNKMVVRARDKKSLQPLMDAYGVKMVNLKNRDYPHRVFLTRKQFVDWLVESGETLDYNNYKTRVSQTRGHDFASPLHDVWATMLRLEDLGKPGYNQRGRGIGSYAYTYTTADGTAYYSDDPEWDEYIR